MASKKSTKAVQEGVEESISDEFPVPETVEVEAPEEVVSFGSPDEVPGSFENIFSHLNPGAYYTLVMAEKDNPTVEQMKKLLPEYQMHFEEDHLPGPKSYDRILGVFGDDYVEKLTEAIGYLRPQGVMAVIVPVEFWYKSDNAHELLFRAIANLGLTKWAIALGSDEGLPAGHKLLVLD